MKIDIHKISGDFTGDSCYVHARACAVSENELIMTAQKLNLHGSDDFSPLVVTKSRDGGKTWSDFVPDDAFITSYDENGIRSVGCDATHLFHKKTKTPLIIGWLTAYEKDAVKPKASKNISAFYATYDEKTGKYSPIKTVEVPSDIFPYGCSSGCSQFIEEENGDILLPVVIVDALEPSYMLTTTVLRLGFDGLSLTFKDTSNFLRTDIPRGFCEGSIHKFKGRYYLTLRNDEQGYYSVSDDGKSFSEPKVWTWDTGDLLPNYNTQQHWFECGGKLYLVYTRRAGNNDHITRHRAPLFMAEVDTEKMCIKRHTEQIVVPERGARLGNFGVTQINENKAIIVAAEWMQPIGCEKYGCDNSIFITTVEA